MTTTTNNDAQNMTTYSESKAAFSQTLEPTTTRRGTTIAAPAEWLWAKHITSLVTGGENFAACDDVAPLAFSDDMTAVPNIGGLITKSYGGLRVGIQAAQNPLEPWVLVVFEGEHIGVTVKEAFERGLNEAVWP